jgi:hypothetical protein
MEARRRGGFVLMNLNDIAQGLRAGQITIEDDLIDEYFDALSKLVRILDAFADKNMMASLNYWKKEVEDVLYQ